MDLAEQDIVSCSYSAPHPYPGSPSKAYDYFEDIGVIDELCFPYTAIGTPCADKCSSPVEQISINSYTENYFPPQEILRQTIIEQGPIAASAMNCMWGTWSHTMQLVGWDVIEWGDENILGIPPDPYVFGEYVGCTYWIYKQNYGNRNDMNGFQYMIHENDDTPIIHIIPTDVTGFVSSNLNTFDQTDIQCLDNDGDGYYWWGIGPKPPQCPQCPDEYDGDDNNSGLGPIDENGFCTIIDTYISDFETTMNYWKQSDDDDCDWIKFYGSTATYPYSGPNGTPDGSTYYIYMNASVCYLNSGAYIESTSIDLDDACAIEMTFAYHKNTFSWGNDETDDSKLSLDISYDNGQSWVEDYWYVMKDHGDEWHYVTISIPSDVNKVRFYAYVGWVNFFNNIALDDITIGKATNNDIVITGDETWDDQNYEICENIFVEPNATLTISEGTTVSMKEGKKIIVKRAGRIVIDGGTITSADDNHWTGIEVHGNKYTGQNYADQGVVEVLNGWHHRKCHLWYKYHKNG